MPTTFLQLALASNANLHKGSYPSSSQSEKELQNNK